MAWLSWVWSAMAAFELRTRPGADDELYRARFESLPPHVRTPSQLLGVATLGCEGTAGVFPACNLSCKPCYHSRDANEVRVDGPHTLRSLEQQMALLQRLHGDGVHCQLIGGEVSLLSAADHAAALQTMLKAGRIPSELFCCCSLFNAFADWLKCPSQTANLQSITFGKSHSWAGCDR